MGEIYCLVCTGDGIISYLCSGDCSSCEYFDTGKCFKIAAEDATEVERVKDLLRRLREPVKECNQLPKLTAEFFDREDCPEWAKYAAVNADGKVVFFSDTPNCRDSRWIVKFYSTSVRAGILDDIIFDATDWKNSLVERPTKLPDWCKVGEWVYSTVHEEYVKIRDIDKFDVTFDSGAYCSVSHKSFVEEYKQARLRPYNSDEMKTLIGKVVGNKHGNMFLVTAFVAVDGGEVCVDGVVYNADDLLDCYTINGEPCGVLEHLNENGEWVS